MESVGVKSHISKFKVTERKFYFFLFFLEVSNFFLSHKQKLELFQFFIGGAQILFLQITK